MQLDLDGLASTYVPVMTDASESVTVAARIVNTMKRTDIDEDDNPEKAEADKMGPLEHGGCCGGAAAASDDISCGDDEGSDGLRRTREDVLEEEEDDSLLLLLGGILLLLL